MNTRKRSAFSVFKSATVGKENALQLASTPNITAALSEYEEQKMAAKANKRVRRGSLPSLDCEGKVLCVKKVLHLVGFY